MALIFNDIHTHMIDDFLFSNPTAQLGGWQGIIIIRSTIDICKLHINRATREYFPYFFLHGSSGVQPFCLLFTPGPLTS